MIDANWRRRAWACGWPYLLLILCCAGFFWDSILFHNAPMMRDMLCDHIGYRALQRRAIWSGHLPTWNYLSGGGQPFLGEPSAMPLYPLHLVFDIFPLVAALKLSLVMHLSIAACGAYSLARAWRCSKPAAMLSGLAYALGTCQLGWMEYLISLSTLVWIPLVIRCAHGVAEQAARQSDEAKSPWLLSIVPASSSITFFAIVLTMEYLGGHAEIFVFSSLVLGLYALIAVPFAFGWRAAIRGWQGLAIGALIALLIASPDWLLLVQHARLSVRESGFDPRMGQASLHPADWLILVLPFLFGHPGYTGCYWAKTIFEFFVGTAYVGLIPLVFAVVALAIGWRGSSTVEARAARGRWLFLTAVLLLGILLASGECLPVFAFFNHYVPGFTRMRWPSKTLIFVHVSLSMLAAIGAQQLINAWRESRSLVRSATFWIATGVATVIGLSLAITLVSHEGGAREKLFATMTLAEPKPDRIADFSHQLQFASVIALLGAIVAAAGVYRRFRSEYLILALVLITYIDLFHIGRQVHPILPDSIYQFSQEMVESETGPISPLRRVHSNYGGIQQMLYASTNVGLIKNSVAVAAGNTWLNADIPNDWSGGLQLQNYAQIYFLFPQLNDQQASRLADLMSVTNLIAPTPRPDLWRNEDPSTARFWVRNTALPRASLLHYWFTPGTWIEGAQLLFSPEFDPTFSAVLQADEDGNAPPGSSSVFAQSTGAVDSVRYDWDRVDIDVHTTGPMLLLLTDTFYPGWRAEVDGKRVPIYCANLAFRGVLLPQGAKHVAFEYRPWQIPVGATLSLTTLATLAGYWIWRWAKRKSRRTNPAALTADQANSV